MHGTETSTLFFDIHLEKHGELPAPRTPKLRSSTTWPSSQVGRSSLIGQDLSKQRLFSNTNRHNCHPNIVTGSLLFYGKGVKTPSSTNMTVPRVPPLRTPQGRTIVQIPFISSVDAIHTSDSNGEELRPGFGRFASVFGVRFV